MNKSNQNLLARATNELLLDSQKNKEKLREVKMENKKLKRKAKISEEAMNIRNKEYIELEKMLVSMLARYDRRCPCENPEECEKLLCFSLQPDEVERRIVVETSSDSDSD